MLTPPAQPTNSPGVLRGTRVLCVLSAISFVGFGFIDMALVDTSLAPFIRVRVLLVLVSTLLLVGCYTRWGVEYATYIGLAVCVWTGSGVVLLTEMTGGSSSPYWTMIMLTFFAVALFLPLRPIQATTAFSFIAVFYFAWLSYRQASGDPVHWLVSNAGIWLALGISVAAVAHLARLRSEQAEIRMHLGEVNTSLQEKLEKREKTEHFALRSQQLDTAARMASSLGHELNNILQVITGAAETIQRDPARTTLGAQRIVQSAQMGARLTHDLLIFAHNKPQSIETVSLKALVEELADMLERAHQRRLEVRLVFGKGTSWVRGDRQALSQALLNLCLNGIHAMNSSGTLSISMETVDLANYRSLDATGPGLHLKIHDTGEGMAPEVLAQAIEPFFTTRPAGEGTGLGLSTAYTTVEKHGGELTLESRLGEGTTAFVVLPRSGPPAPTRTDSSPGAQARRTVTSPGTHAQEKTEFSALLVDDDDMVRQVMGDTMSVLGFQVQAVSSGPSALSYLEVSPIAPDLIVLDLLMPELSGVQTFHKIRELHPRQPILLYSGTAPDQSIEALLAAGYCRFLRKPFQTDVFSEVIDSLMAESASP